MCNPSSLLQTSLFDSVNHQVFFDCMSPICLSIGLNATGSLPFILSNATGSLPFIWLNAMGSLPFQLASMPLVPCLSFGLMPRVHCHFHLASLPYLGYIACPTGVPHLPLWRPICLFGTPFAFMAPHLPFGAPYAFCRPHPTP